MLVGVGIGLLTLKMGWNYIEKNRQSAQASQGGTPIVIASRDVAPGTPLQLDDLKTTEWPRSATPTGAHSDAEEMVGRVSRTRLVTNLPVLENMLAPPGTTAGLPALIPAGYQAMAVKVDEFAGVGGFLKPGDKVDVVATFNVKRGKAGGTEMVTRTILRAITVSAVGQEVQPGEENQPMIVRSVTLLVKPLEAQWLSMASTRGTIRLSLRSGQSVDSVEDLPAISFDELLRGDLDGLAKLGKPKKVSGWMKNLLTSKEVPQPEVVVPVAVKIDPKWSMQVIKGAEIQRIVFENAASDRRVKPGSKLIVNPQNLKKLDGKSKKFEYIQNELFGHEEATQ